MTMHRALSRFAVPALLIALAGWALLRGGDVLPSWIANLSAKTGLGPDRMLRLLVAAALAGATVAAASAAFAGAIAWITAAALAFSGLAELSAIVNAPGDSPVPLVAWASPLASLAVGATVLALLSRPRATADRAPRPAAWGVLGALAAATAAMAISARLPFAQRTAAGVWSDGVPTVTLNPDEWLGLTASQAGIARHLPLLTPLTMDGTVWVVFYSPDCGRCHQVFEAYFAGPQGGQVVAVRIPHVPGQTYVKTDQPEDIACEGCERLALPEGTRWVITSPTIVRFQGGTVDCVTSADYSRCRQGSGELP